jgi:hypothetical protein
MKLTLLLPLLAVLLQAAPPIATISTGGALKINNQPIPTTGAPTWPLAKGDEVVTGLDPATIVFPDGARFTMQPNTRLVIRQCDICVLQLFEGSLAYKILDASASQVCALGRPVQPAPRTEGKIVIESADRVVVQTAGKDQLIDKGDCSCDTAAPWYRRKAALIVLAGGGATAATLAVTKPGKKSKKKDEQKK